MHLPRIMIAGTKSGVGKTTISLSIMAGLTMKGYQVQSFKVGPDYIDPSHHTAVTGSPSINLDTFLTSQEAVVAAYSKYSSGKDIAVIEGVMGLFDGWESRSNQGSSAEVAAILGCPVILVIDVRGMARSAVAMAKGYVDFCEKTDVAGLILNNIGSQRHQQILQDAFADFPVPVIGYISRNSEIQLKERHLGLIPSAEENQDDQRARQQIYQQVIAQLDMEGLLSIAKKGESHHASPKQYPASSKTIKLAIARDKAFNFYYHDGLALLEEKGAELLEFSPIADQALPKGISGIIIGGGFPELYLEELSANKSIQHELRTAHARGMPIYAECGGYMYLCRGIFSFSGAYYPMVNLIPADAKMEKKLVGLGYRAGHIQGSSVLGDAGSPIKGHEFHYSDLVNLADDYPWAFKLFNSRKNQWVEEGFNQANLVASYLHLHWRGNEKLAESFLYNCSLYKEKEG